jgi:protein pelota
VKILEQDKSEGRVKVRADTMDDLWHLSHVIRPGDRVRGVTQRRLEDQRDLVRDKESQRVTVTLGIDVEDVEFHEATSRLRVLGVIEEAPEEVATGTHHTIGLEVHDWVEIVKPEGWPEHQLERLDEAVEATTEPKVVVVAMDDETATVAVLHQFGPREIATKTRTGGGKMYDADRGEDAYHEDVRNVLATTAPENCPVIVVGPGFAREKFVDHLETDPVDGLGSIVSEASAHPGMRGVHEAMNRGLVEQVAESSRVSEETQAVEELLKRIGQEGGLATYGPEEVEHALNLGAVETLLVADELAKDPEVDELMEQALHTGADVKVIGTGHDAGQTLESLTGLGALLRFEIGQPAP